MTFQDYEIHVFITNYIPEDVSLKSKISDFIRPRMSYAYLRSWIRLLKHGTRGQQPWKRDVMTIPRERASNSRNSYLAQVIRALEMIPCKSLSINIYANKKQSIATTKNSTQISWTVKESFKRMNSFNNSPWEESDPDSPWNLVWENRASLQRLHDTELPEKILFLILENDVLFSAENLIYWLDEREKLRKSGLLPGFIRVEYSQIRNEWLCIDIHDRKYLDTPDFIKRHEISRSSYVQISKLYNGLIVLDKELLGEFVKSTAFDKKLSKSLIWWDMGARASSGLQFVNTPQGFSDRYLMAFDESNEELHAGSSVHHLPNLYSAVQEVSANMPSLRELNIMASQKRPLMFRKN